MDILLTGSVAYDYLMTFPGLFKEHFLPDHLDSLSLSFLVDSMVKRRGGVSPNIAYTFALLGGKPRILAPVGEDFEDYRTQLDKTGIDTTNMRVIPGEFTASFFVNTDQSNAQIASFYPGAMAHASSLSLSKNSLGVPDLVVISPNDPAAMIKYVDECQATGLAYFYDPSQQIIRLDKNALQNGIRGARAIFVNEYEFELIQQRSEMTSDEIINYTDFTVVTSGAYGSSIYVDDTELHIPIVPAKQIVDPTGVGDAFRGGFLTGFANSFDLTLCGQMGALAATYCLEAEGPQAQTYTKDEFYTRFVVNFGSNSQLAHLFNIGNNN